MTRKELYSILNKKILLLDGATGTELHYTGLPNDVCPELWAIENPDKLTEIQNAYIDAGSDAVYSCTFGANRIKLSQFDLSEKTQEINEKSALISRNAAGKKALVMGNIGPTGSFLEPFGNLLFEEAVDIFKEQAAGLLRGGVDLFVIETMMDIQEARAALIAVKELCNLPVIVTMTFTEEGVTLTGTLPATAVITLQSLGAAAVGCNCSMGPEFMVKLIHEMKTSATVPLLAKPNAGLPKLINGKTVFNMKANEFAEFGPAFVEAGVNMLGGCCGTSPDFIKKLKTSIKNLKPHPPLIKSVSAVTSSRKTVFFARNQPMTIIGERINPTGKNLLKKELSGGKFKEVRRFAHEQEQKGAHIIDINVGMPGIDEKATMLSAVKFLSLSTEIPLCLDSSDVKTVETALRIYPGRALVNSISCEKNKIKRLLPIAARYGAMFILLPLGDNEVPETADLRWKYVKRIMEEAEKFGYHREDILVDGLVMTVSSNQDAAKETLNLIQRASENGFNTVLGISNVSFGLPERKWINSAFLAMAAARGLTAAIANPDSGELMSIKYACDVLTSKDKGCGAYISRFPLTSTAGNAVSQNVPFMKYRKAKGGSPRQQVYQAVLAGDREHILQFVKEAVKAGVSAGKLVDDSLIPAINKVGDLFEQQKYFLPQLIMSAETMKSAFEFLEPYLTEKKRTSTLNGRHKVILATVKGDIHDIGKNIVALMLKNYGFDVIDLGKDVGSNSIIKAIRDSDAKLVGLSALMTTTMTQMKNIIAECRKAGIHSANFMVGGAVVDKTFAEEIGAQGYASDAVEAVRLAKKLLNIR